MPHLARRPWETTCGGSDNVIVQRRHNNVAEKMHINNIVICLKFKTAQYMINGTFYETAESRMAHKNCTKCIVFKSLIKNIKGTAS